MTEKALPYLVYLAIMGLILGLDLSVGVALIIGIVCSLLMSNPDPTLTKKAGSKILSYAVIGLGAGLNLETIIKTGIKGLFFTFVQLTLVFIVGLLLAKILKMKGQTWLLITSGTAICGGSAIASVSTALNSDSDDISVSMGVVFILNALALYIFPSIGQWLELTQYQFGLWSALAIHDTSSVVGSTLQYGVEALSIGTTFKLTRALWIVPVTLILSIVFVKPGDNNSKTIANPPWFILGFILMAAIFTYFSALKELGFFIESIARQLFAICLFLVGTNISPSAIRKVGWKPMAHGLFLWILVSFSSLILIIKNLNG